MSQRPALSVVARDIAAASIPPATVLVVHLIRQYLLPEATEYDVVAHAVGGLSIAWMGIILWLRWSSHKWIPKDTPLALRFLTIWGFVALIGVFWEFMEWTCDYFLHTQMQPSLTDTMNDLFMDLLGGMIFLLLFRLWEKQRGK
jgi:hypothetical protein